MNNYTIFLFYVANAMQMSIFDHRHYITTVK